MEHRKSKIESSKNFNEKIWIVSTLRKGFFTGESMIVVEGLKRDPEGDSLKLFVGHYTLQYKVQQQNWLNEKGYISKVKIKENDKYFEDYSKSSFQSHYVEAQAAQNMINSIHDDSKEVKNSVKDGSNAIPYQLRGKQTLFTEQGAGDNSTGWVRDKLALAGIGDGSGKTKPGKLTCLAM